MSSGGCGCHPVRSLGRIVGFSLCVLVGSEVVRILRTTVADPSPVGPSTAIRGIVGGASDLNETAAGSRSAAAHAGDALFRDNLELAQPRPVNVSVVLVGDSVTRYQYFSLAYFLKYGHWFDPNAHPSIVYSHTFHHPRLQDLDWGEFFYETNRMLYPHEICDCQRYSNFQLERRYFYDPARNNTVVYVNLNGDQPTDSKLPGYYFGGLDPEPIFGNFSHVLEQLAPPSRTFRQKRLIQWKFTTWRDVLQFHVGRLRMSGQSMTVFLNAGLHRHNLRPATFTNLTRNDSHSSTMRIVWKTTTYTKRLVVDTLDTTDAERTERQLIDEVDQQFCQSLDCFDVSWTKSVGRPHFYDALHYREPVYRILNEQLLEFVHAIPPGYVRLDRDRVLSRRNLSSVEGKTAPTDNVARGDRKRYGRVNDSAKRDWLAG